MASHDTLGKIQTRPSHPGGLTWMTLPTLLTFSPPLLLFPLVSRIQAPWPPFSSTLRASPLCLEPFSLRSLHSGVSSHVGFSLEKSSLTGNRKKYFPTPITLSHDILPYFFFFLMLYSFIPLNITSEHFKWPFLLAYIQFRHLETELNEYRSFSLPYLQPLEKHLAYRRNKECRSLYICLESTSFYPLLLNVSPDFLWNKSVSFYLVPERPQLKNIPLLKWEFITLY